MVEAGETAGGATAAESLKRLAAEYWDWQMAESPISSTYLGLRLYDDRLDERGPAARERREKAATGMLERVERVPPDDLEGEDRITRAILVRGLSEEIESYRHRAWEWDLDQLAGLHIGLQDLVNVHPLVEPGDATKLVARYRAVPKAFEEVIGDLKDGIASGRVAPRIAYDRVLGQVRGLTSTPPAKSSFAGPAGRLPASWPAPERARLASELSAAVESSVYPAYRAFQRFLETDYRGKAREDVGVWAIPGGDEAYAFRVRNQTTTKRAPKAIHDLGLSEVEKNKAEMLEIARADGVFGPGGAKGAGGDLRSYLDGIGKDARFRLATRDDVLGRYRAICKRMDGRLAEVFGILPKAAYEVKPLEEYREKDAPAAYYLQPAIDRSRGGIFYANTYKPESWPTYEMETLCYHEAVPGHHLQVAIAQELDGLPTMRRHAGFTAYVEGWAHYAERLADEMGMYSTPYDRIGMLAAQAWRAARLVVDTGMHSLRWTREKAVEYLRSIRTGPLNDVENEVDRYVIWPGQALAYKIGQRTIADARDRAKKRLGARFDLRGFHDEVLKHGALPLSILEDQVHAWDGTTSR